ncbi:MAG: hypothetical protein KDK36_02665 [Leptospiraceae bacterium]|nr:hypothetical protein [Leptospiraceae bacterium]
MITLLTVLITAGLIALILHWLYVSSDKEMDEKEKIRRKKEEEFLGADPKKVYSKKWDKNIPRPRICPACGTALKKTEFLYASMEDNPIVGEKKQVHIYGCKYCYLGKVEDEELDVNVQESLDI